MARKPPPISGAMRTKLKEARIARLATLDAQCKPQVVPVCFVYADSVLYTAVDLKPKRVPPERLARLRNISAEPQVALVIDEYDEDWTRLWWILVRGKAKLIPPSAHKERARALRALRAKYPQYAAGMLPDDAPMIRIAPHRITGWGKL